MTSRIVSICFNIYIHSAHTHTRQNILYNLEPTLNQPDGPSVMTVVAFEQQCDNIEATVWQHCHNLCCSYFVHVLFQCCSRFVPIMVCSNVVHDLFQLCSRFVPVMVCSSFVHDLFQCWNPPACSYYYYVLFVHFWDNFKNTNVYHWQPWKSIV